MEAKTITREVRLREWAQMVSDCQCSNKDVKTWCAEHEIKPKTYWYRQHQVQKAALALHGCSTITQSAVAQELSNNTVEFADIGSSVMYSPTAPVTVRINGMSVELQNSADSELIANTFRAIRGMQL
jgi:hypothetical protein